MSNRKFTIEITIEEYELLYKLLIMAQEFKSEEKVVTGLINKLVEKRY